MSLLGRLRRKRSIEDSPVDVRISYHLKRIADALERAYPPPFYPGAGARKISGEDVHVVDDTWRVQQQAERDAATLRGHLPKKPKL